MYDIFISYRTTHSQWVETLALNLRDQGYAVFLDRWELIPGQDFAATLHEALGSALRKEAEARYGGENVFHVFPPNSTRADSAAYFGRLARQCHVGGQVRENWQWAQVLEERLDDGRDLFLLVSGFENGTDESRAELAGELRMLNERYYTRFHLVMMGSIRLAALKYAQGSMSLLNIAEELPIPELSSRDLIEIFGTLYPRLALTSDQIQEVLAFTGGHPRLLHFCLQQGTDTADACRQVLSRSPLPGQLFTHFHEARDHLSLCTLLRATRLGQFDTWPADHLLRKLYWTNLITRRGGDFAWRCGFLRQTGLEMLACA